MEKLKEPGPGVLTDLEISEPIKKLVSAKEVSKWSMIIAALWIGFLSLVKAAWGLISKSPFGLEMGDIIFSGLALAAVFTPVYFSIILDKIKDIKIGGK